MRKHIEKLLYILFGKVFPHDCRWGLLAWIMIVAQAGAGDLEKQYRDWALRCTEGKFCRLEQRVFVEGAEESPLIHMVFQAPSQSEGLLVLLRVPLGVLLSAGLHLQVDQGTPQTFSLHHCRSEGCLAVFPLTAKLRRIFETGREAQISFHVLDGRRIGVPISLLGVTAGLRALNERMVHVKQNENQ